MTTYYYDDITSWLTIDDDYDDEAQAIINRFNRRNWVTEQDDYNVW